MSRGEAPGVSEDRRGEPVSSLGALSAERQELLRRLLKKKGVESARGGHIPRRPDPGAPAPLSFAQARLWLLDRLEAGSALYNVPAVARLPGRHEAPVLARQLAQVIRRHEALRTTFGEGADGEPYQVVGPPWVPPVPLWDLTALPAAAREAEAVRLATWQVGRPFDLARGPLLRAALLRLTAATHVFALALHHIVADGWSCGVLLNELNALSAGVALPEPPVQYADFAVWQRGNLAGETLAGQLAFWRESLAGIPESLELPADRPRPAAPSGRGGRRRFHLGAAVTAALRELASREGATLFAVLLAAFDALLARLAGQDELAVGTVVANRNRAEIEGLIGFFVNTLTLPARLTGDPGFAELVRRTRETANAAVSHQDLPFERLVEELAPERVAGQNPLFQVVFALQNAITPVHPGQERLELLPVETGTAKFDLGLSLAEDLDGLVGELEYAADLFDATTAERFAAHFATLIAAAAAAPVTPLSALPLLDEAGRHQILLAWNDTAVAPGPAHSIPEELTAAVGAAPDALALAMGEEQASYAALAARARRLARHLARRGVEPEVAVGVCLERSPELIVALWAILEAGGAYVPLDLDYPEARLASMLEQAGARLVVTREGLAGRAVFAGRERVLVDADAAAIAGESAAPPAPRLLPGNLAYIPFTSGSTGRPKGVAITHRGALRLVREGGYARFAADERFLLVSPISFDPSTAEIWGALTHGATLALLPPGVPSIDGLAAELARHQTTTLWLSAGLFHEVAEARPAALAGVRQLMAGGEALAPAAVRRALAALPDLRLVDSYGPTEVTTFTTCFRVDLAAVHQTVPIGRPIGNTRVYALDRWLGPVPIGVAGELFAGGDGLARGYAGRPELTAERFVPDPVSGLPGERLYRTGDRVRLRADGLIEFLGRFDDQVKVRGFRIEPAEVEAVLAGCAGVAQAAVLATAPAPGESRRLVAFVAAQGAAALDAGELARELAGRLPDYMVPGAFVRLDALPITPTGKVDRKALAARVREAVDVEAGKSPAAFATATEELLAAVWAEVLGVPAVGPADSFFALGGHSLLATRAAARVRDVFGVELPLRDFFEAAGLAELAARLDRRRTGGALDFPPIERRPRGAGRDSEAPLSFAQERLWLLDRLSPQAAIYNVPTAERFAGPLDAGRLDRCLVEVARRHEILRSRFAVAADGRPVQVVDPPPARLLALVDLAALPAARAEAELSARLWEEAFRPFDLSRSPLLRAALFRLAAEDHAWMVVRHHIATDGWSAEILQEEMAALYGAYAAGLPSPLPELPVQYADFAVWQRRYLGEEVLAGQLAYWQGQLAGAPPLLDLPADRPRPPEQGYEGAIRTLILPDALAADLLALGRRLGATRYMVLLAAFAALLARYTGGTDLVLGTPVANRRRTEVQELIGFFANTLALRLDLSGDPPFAELLARVRSVALAAYDHQDLPFERLVEELNPVRDPSYPPLVQVVFVQQGKNRRDLDPADRSEPTDRSAQSSLFSRVASGRALSRFDVELYAFEVGEGLELDLEYRIDLFDAPRMERLLEHLATLLAAVAAGLEVRLAALPLLSAAERQQILTEWGEGLWEGWRDGALLHELVGEQAARTPAAPALVAGAIQLSYAELWGWAAGIAGELARRGVGPEDRVGVLARREAGLLAGLLGTLRAGAAYVPLDPTYPPARLERIAADAGLAALLVSDGLGGELPEVDVPRLSLGEPGGPLGPIRPIGPIPSPESLAYLIYTSGSTGVPKGVTIRHGSAVAMVRWALATFSPAELLRVAAVTSVNFDISVFEIFVPLAAGGTVVLLDNALALTDPGPAPTLTFTVPSAMAEVARAGLPPSLSTIALGGEPLYRELADRVYGAPAVRRLWNLYGPSEDTTCSTAYRVSRGSGDEPTLGRALPGTRAVLRDAAGALVPIGNPGELCLAGAGLARGYWRRPELTAASFLPDPEALEPGGRLYRTGDLARFLPAGELQLLGRIDAQVKVRGFRIELPEIELALARHPALAGAAVLALGEGEDRRLAAFVAPAGAATPAELRAFLGDTLPDYMVPPTFRELDALPLSVNGKIDRRALAILAEIGGPAPEATPPEPPQGPTEESLADLWRELLRPSGAPEPPRVGRHDRFFDLGGHSLLGARLIARIAEAFGVELPLRRLFDGATVAELAREIDQARGTVPIPGATIPRQPRGAPLPAGYYQQWGWGVQGGPVSAFYNIPFGLRLHGPLALPALQGALAELVRRQESLRTRLVLAGDGETVLQVIDPAGEPRLPLIDLAALPAARHEGVLAALVATDAEAPFDARAEPLFRVHLVRLGREDHTLLVNLNHLVGDGWSVGVFRAELAALYLAFAAGRPSPLSELPVQAADFAVWQREAETNQLFAGQLAYWRRRLAGIASPLVLPGDFPYDPLLGPATVQREIPLAPEMAARIRALAQVEGATPAMVILTGVQLLLAAYTGEADILVGSTLAGRSRPELAAVIGFLMNTVVHRTDLSGRPSFREALARVRSGVLEDYRHQDLPFPRLLADLLPGQPASRMALTRVMLNMLTFPELPAADLAASGLGFEDLWAMRDEHARFDLIFVGGDSAGGGLSLHLSAAASRFLPGTVTAIADDLGTLLAAAARHPDAALSELLPAPRFLGALVGRPR